MADETSEANLQLLWEVLKSSTVELVDNTQSVTPPPVEIKAKDA